MATVSLTKTRLQAGIWEGILSCEGANAQQPEIEAFHLDQPVAGIKINAGSAENQWLVHIPVPLEAVSDGVHTIIVVEKVSGDLLTSFSLVSGEPLSEDIRTETALLRAELDMLKRAFRRHCLETMG